MKKVICILLAAALLAALAGCGESAGSAVTQAPATQAPATQAPATQMPATAAPVTPVPATPAPEPTPTPTPEPTPEPDPYVMLRVDESFAKEVGGTYLKRNGKLYSLCELISLNTSKQYDIGFGTYKQAVIYLTTNSQGKSGTEDVMLGDVPLITFIEEDQVISYNDIGVRLFEVAQVGYTIEIIDTGSRYQIFTDSSGMTELKKSDITQFQVCDMNGNIYEDFHDFTQGEVYMVSWYQGTTYNELKMKADCPYYYVPSIDSENEAYFLEGELTRNGYAIYDFSGVAPGIYRISCGNYHHGYLKVE